MKKVLSILGGIAITCFSAVSFTSAYTQEQIQAYEWAYKYGITTQPTIEAARMNSPITRQAFSKMVINYLENVVKLEKSVSNSCFFPDENNITNNLKYYVKKACTYQLMGSNGEVFNPTQSMDRAQVGTVLSRILWGDKHNSSGRGYYIYHVNALEDAGIMHNIKNATNTPAKRGDVMIMFKRMYEKFSSSVYLNNGNNIISSYTPTNETIKLTENNENSDNDYISNVYNNSNVIYTGKDGIRYYYDDKFLNLLKNVAKKQGETDLVTYLNVEAEYFKNGLDQLANLDDEDLLKSIGIDVDSIDPDNMTQQEKQELIKKFKSSFSKIISENKDKNNKLLKDLEKVIKNIKNDRFSLKEKYAKTKTFIEASNSFLDQYSESIFSLMEIALMEKDENSEEGLAQAFGLVGITLVYQGEAEAYQQYVEEWAVDTIGLLGGELSTNNTNNNTRGNNTKNNIDNSTRTLVCTLNNSNSDGINVKGIYKVNYSGEYVNLVDTIESVNSNDEQGIEYYKNILEEAYKPYKNLKYYDYNIKTTKNTLTSKVTINYEKIDMNKYLKINQNTIFIENGKVSLKKLKLYYESIGATCE